MTVPPFLEQHVGAYTGAAGTVSRPHITLTWAQSLDMKIAGPGGARVTLSGAESTLMTHWWVELEGQYSRVESRQSCEAEARE
jgi:2,5-diamino-6-(ribosylamino)-4(3H)-pyrimidinone 5'-phosphate reductase